MDTFQTILNRMTERRAGITLAGLLRADEDRHG
jgi:hypothetical protein